MKTRTLQREMTRAAARRDEAIERGLLDGQGTSALAGLGAIARERDRLADLELAYVTALRAVRVPWSVIGQALGITGQAASRRYRDL